MSRDERMTDERFDHLEQISLAASGRQEHLAPELREVLDELKRERAQIRAHVRKLFVEMRDAMNDSIAACDRGDPL